MSIKYEPKHWELVVGRMMVFRPLGVSLYIWPCGSTLTAVPAHCVDEDQVLSDDVEELKTLAVTAYLDAIGFTKTELRGPKPN